MNSAWPRPAHPSLSEAGLELLGGRFNRATANGKLVQNKGFILHAFGIVRKIASLAHNHIYLAKDSGDWQVTGIIDWGEAMLGPAEWDIAYLWFWTFSCNQAAMHECLQTLYADHPRPSRFARRCMAATLYTSSMSLLWPHFAKHTYTTESIEREMTAFFFPPDVFGPPD